MYQCYVKNIRTEDTRCIHVEDLLNSGRPMGCNVYGHLSFMDMGRFNLCVVK